MDPRREAQTLRQGEMETWTVRWPDTIYNPVIGMYCSHYFLLLFQVLRIARRLSRAGEDFRSGLEVTILDMARYRFILGFVLTSRKIHGFESCPVQPRSTLNR